MKSSILPWEILKEAYGIVRADPLRIVGRFAIMLIFFLAAHIVIGNIFIFGIIISTLFTFCTTLFGLTHAERGDFTLDMILLKLKWRKLLSFFIVSLLAGLAIAGGLILLVIPGIIAAVMLRMVKFIALDRSLKPREVLAESVRMTKGNRFRLLEYMVIALLINVGGFICLVVGIFFTLPITVIGFALIYKKLSLSVETQTAPTVVEAERVEAEVIEPA